MESKCLQIIIVMYFTYALLQYNKNVYCYEFVTITYIGPTFLKVDHIFQKIQVNG